MEEEEEEKKEKRSLLSIQGELTPCACQTNQPRINTLKLQSFKAMTLKLGKGLIFFTIFFRLFL